MISANDRSDSLVGGMGADTLTGQLAGDYFVYYNANESTALAQDIITDFTSSLTEYQSDYIFLSGSDFSSITGINNGAADATNLGYSYDGSDVILTSNGGWSLKLQNTATIGVVIDVDTNGSFYSGDLLLGGAGNDTLYGSYQAKVYGGEGDDVICFRPTVGGSNMMTGGAGADTFTGGAGTDRFYYHAASESNAAARDVITNFNAAGDLLMFSGLLSGTFSFVGNEVQAFAGGGNSSARFNDTTKLLEIDTNGDAAADMHLTLTGVSIANLSAADFNWS